MTDTSALQGKTAAYYTLGCKLNFAETSAFSDRLREMGVRTAGRGETADICLINTCAVTQVAEHKCRQTIHRAIRRHPGALVVVTGCYAQLRPESVAAIEGVRLVVGANEKASLVELIGQTMTAQQTLPHIHATASPRNITTFTPSCSRGNRTRYFLKVQDGCNYHCTYCTIPAARGNSRNAPIASLAEQSKEVARQGAKEIILTGVNIGDFGRTTGETLLELIKALDDIQEICRYRISSIEPNLLTDDIISYCATSRAFMPHFHIPLQSGSDHVLRLMHRRYDTALFADKIKTIRQVMPDAFIGVDVITGSRGETQEYFDETYNLLSSLPVSQLHVFPYSERPGTAALKIPHVVGEHDRRERTRQLLQLSEQKRLAFYSRHEGQKAQVLFEKSPAPRPMHGFTKNYIRVELPAEHTRPEYDNQLIDVTLGPLNHDQTALIAQP